MSKPGDSLGVEEPNGSERPHEVFRASESLFEGLLESAPDAVVIVNRDGRIVLVNTQAERMFGYRRQELLGQPVEVLVPERFRQKHAEQRASYLSRPSARPMGAGLDLVGQRKDGSEMPVDICLSPLKTEGGLLVTSAIRDITDRRRAEAALKHSERRFRGIFNQTFHFIALLEPDGTLLEANQTALDYRGLKPEEVVGRRFWDTPWWDISAEAQNPLQAAVLQAAQGQFVRYEVALLAPDGSVASYDFSLKPLTDETGQVVLLIAEGRDITERKRHEQAQRERDLLRAEQMMALGQVAAGVAHELRNPLTAIKGLVQVNRKEAEARGLPAEDLRIIEQEIRRMERTLQTFLEFARPPQPQRRRLNLAAVVERTLSLIGGRANKQRVALRFWHPDSPVFVEADQDQLQQLLLNLALNALDTMPRGGTLEVGLHAPLDGRVELRVLDTGPGIAPQLLPRIFEAFVSSKETGLGLGLAISRRVAEDHGGTLSAYNRAEGGACLVVILPVAVPDQLGEADQDTQRL